MERTKMPTLMRSQSRKEGRYLTFTRCSWAYPNGGGHGAFSLQLARLHFQQRKTQHPYVLPLLFFGKDIGKEMDTVGNENRNSPSFLQFMGQWPADIAEVSSALIL